MLAMMPRPETSLHELTIASGLCTVALEDSVEYLQVVQHPRAELHLCHPNLAYTMIHRILQGFYLAFNNRRSKKNLQPLHNEKDRHFLAASSAACFC